jgi:hypothetical protein
MMRLSRPCAFEVQQRALTSRDGSRLCYEMVMNARVGPLTPSAELLGVLRLCEALGDRVPREPTLSSSAVRDIERELGATLPDDALVIMAVDCPTLRCATHLVLDEILDVHEDWSNGVPDEQVAIAAVYSEPFAEVHEGAHGGPYEVLAIPRGTDAKQTTIVVVSDGAASDEPSTLAAFAREKIEAWHRRDDWLRILAAARSWDAPFTPRLVAGPKEESHAPERWVTHPAFGRGRLLEIRDDKWTVAFASGTKVLKSNALTEEPQAPNPARPKP